VKRSFRIDIGIIEHLYLKVKRKVARRDFEKVDMTDGFTLQSEVIYLATALAFMV